MKLLVRYDHRQMAVVMADPGRPVIIKILDPQFEPWSNKIINDRLRVLRDAMTHHGHRMFSTTTDQRDEHYGLAIKQYLERHGFEVAIDNPELDEAVLQAVQALPDDTPGKAVILNEVPSLTTLEKTALLAKITPPA